MNHHLDADTLDISVRSFPNIDQGKSDTIQTLAGLLVRSQTGDCVAYLLCRPKATRPELGPPPFQIAKGTRKNLQGQDVFPSKQLNENNLESLLQTALDEAYEELWINSVVLTGAQLFDTGIHAFRSASSNRKKLVQLYLLQTDKPWAPQHPDATEDIEFASEVAWIPLTQMPGTVRDDHMAIIKRIEGWLHENIRHPERSEGTRAEDVP